MCRLKCVPVLRMSTPRETRSDSYFKDESKKKEGGAYLMLMLVACLIWQSGWEE